MKFVQMAEATLSDVRKLLKNTKKAGNKGYDASFGDRLRASNKQEAKWDKRNETMLEVNGLLRAGTVVPIADRTVLEAGKLLYEHAYTNRAEWYGNCGEQAAIALYLCHCNFYITSRDLFLVSMSKPKFQHSLAAFGDPRQDPTAAFCDPWMNIACVFSDYPKLARQKLVEWTGKLKRIASGTYTKGLGPFARTCVNWMEPTNDDVMGFWDGKFYIWNSLERPTIGRI